MVQGSGLGLGCGVLARSADISQKHMEDSEIPTPNIRASQQAYKFRAFL